MANRFPLIFNSGAGQIQELAASDNLDLTSSNLVNAGILFTSSGSATAPSLQIGSGTTYNPGLYSPGTDQLAISTSGTGRITVDASGNVNIDSNTLYVDAVNNRVGMGTSGPNVPLQVIGGSTVTDPVIRATNSGATQSMALTSAGLRMDGGAPIQINQGGSEVARIDSSGNLGLGVVPSNWASFGSAFEIAGKGNFIGGNSTQTYLGNNSYYNAAWKYVNTAASSYYLQSAGSHFWYNAPSGTAGNTISFTEAMRLDISGGLSIGATAASGNKLMVNGTIRSFTQGSRTGLAYQIDNTNGAVSWSQPNLIGHWYTGSQDALSIRVPSSSAANTGSYDIYTDGTHIWYGTTTAAERARIDSSGNMGIGVVPSSQYSTVRVLQFGALGGTTLGGNTSAGGTSFFGQNFYTDPSTAVFKYAASSYAATNYTQFAGEHRWFNAAAGTAGNTITFTQAMTLDASGRLGIGTNSPSDRLTIFGGGQANTGIVARFGNFTGAPAPSKIHFTDNYIWDWAIGGNSSGNFVFNSSEGGSTAGSTRMLITAAGLVGIGTTSPGYALDVINNSTYQLRLASSTSNYASGGLYLGAAGTGDPYYYGYVRWNQDSTTLDIAAQDGTGAGGLRFLTNGGTTSPTERARIDSSGRLLVGTSTASTNCLGQFESSISGLLSVRRNLAGSGGPSLLLAHTRGTAGTYTVLTNGDELGTIEFRGADGTQDVAGAFIQAYVDSTPGANDMPGRLVFSTTADGAASPTERMRITNGGAITCGPQVSGSDLVGTEACGFVADGVYAPVYKVKSSLTSTKYAALFFNGNGQVGNISMSGSSTAYNTSSDYRLKENVVPVPDGITRLLQLKPSRFNFKADPDHTVDGFLAHEAQAVVPECVTGEKDAVDDDGNPVYQGIDQSKLVPLLTAALQEAIGEIELLKARLTAAGI